MVTSQCDADINTSCLWSAFSRQYEPVQCKIVCDHPYFRVPRREPSYARDFSRSSGLDTSGRGSLYGSSRGGFPGDSRERPGGDGRGFSREGARSSRGDNPTRNYLETPLDRRGTRDNSDVSDSETRTRKNTLRGKERDQREKGRGANVNKRPVGKDRDRYDSNIDLNSRAGKRGSFTQQNTRNRRGSYDVNRDPNSKRGSISSNRDPSYRSKDSGYGSQDRDYNRENLARNSRDYDNFRRNGASREHIYGSRDRMPEIHDSRYSPPSSTRRSQRSRDSRDAPWREEERWRHHLSEKEAKKRRRITCNLGGTRYDISKHRMRWEKQIQNWAPSLCTLLRNWMGRVEVDQDVVGGVPGVADFHLENIHTPQ